MVAHCVDVGQADATLLEFPCGAILIDVGAQDDAATDRLVAYLEDFFVERPDLDRTLAAVFVTHNHIDHTRALREVAERFTILRYVDNGQLEGLGTEDPNWIRENAHSGGRSVAIREIDDDEIASLPERQGMTDGVIDPLECETCDPRIRVLSGRLDRDPGWSLQEFDNKNNHSLAVRVDFGDASFLFTGDMEKDAIAVLLAWYSGTDALDVDVWHVGHHGSHNATTPPLVDAIKPLIAVISCGRWDYGRGTSNRFTTWWYGHPRADAVTQLEKKIRRLRSQSILARVAEGPQQFSNRTIRKAIYATPWDGTVRIYAKLVGDDFRVTRNN